MLIVNSLCGYVCRLQYTTHQQAAYPNHFVNICPQALLLRVLVS